MKTIGLIGGMSWESSSEYYQIINQVVHAKLGGFHSAKCLMYSVDFAEIETLQVEGRWAEAAQMLADAARNLEKGGADFIVLCTNTMHKSADEIQAAVTIPFLHIADATAEKILAKRIRKVALLGTRYTMQEDFYKGRLSEKFGLSVMVPNPQEQEVLHRIIFEELVVGKIEPQSKKDYLEIIERLINRGVDGIILGCTEIGLLVQQSDVQVPIFDTARIHAEAAVEFALK